MSFSGRRGVYPWAGQRPDPRAPPENDGGRYPRFSPHGYGAEPGSMPVRPLR